MPAPSYHKKYKRAQEIVQDMLQGGIWEDFDKYVAAVSDGQSLTITGLTNKQTDELEDIVYRADRRHEIRNEIYMLACSTDMFWGHSPSEVLKNWGKIDKYVKKKKISKTPVQDMKLEELTPVLKAFRMRYKGFMNKQTAMANKAQTANLLQELNIKRENKQNY